MPLSWKRLQTAPHVWQHSLWITSLFIRVQPYYLTHTFLFGHETIQLKLKPGSHLCDKHNSSEISISISTCKKKETCSFFLVLISLVLCLSHKCEPALRFAAYSPKFEIILIHLSTWNDGLFYLNYLGGDNFKTHSLFFTTRVWVHFWPKLWNSIPDSFRTIRSFTEVFKTTIRKLDLSGLIWS